MDRRMFLHRGLAAGVATPLLSVTADLYPITGMRIDLFNYANATGSHLAQDGFDVVDYNTLRIQTYLFADGHPTEYFYSHIKIWALLNDPGVPPWRLPSKASQRLDLWGQVDYDKQIRKDTGSPNGVKVTQTNQDLSTHTGLWMVEADTRRPAPNDGEVIYSKRVIFRKVA